MDLPYSILFGFALGFSLTIPPGPMNALIAYQSVRSLRNGIITGLGAMSSDLVLGVLIYAARSEIPLGSVVRWVYLVGAIVMVVLGCRLLLRARVSDAPPSSGMRTYSQAFGVGLSNPFQIIWWLTAGLPSPISEGSYSSSPCSPRSRSGSWYSPTRSISERSDVPGSPERSSTFRARSCSCSPRTSCCSRRDQRAGAPSDFRRSLYLERNFATFGAITIWQ